MRRPLMRTAPIAMISSVRVFRPVVSQSSATHSSGGGASSRKAHSPPCGAGARGAS
jgi:hypothetical protein